MRFSQTLVIDSYMALELPATWLAAFPGTKFHPEERLLTWRPAGVLNAILGDAILRWIESVEPEFGTINRFGDLTGLEEVRLTLSDLSRFAFNRRKSYTGESTVT